MFYFALMAELWFDSTDFRWHLIVNDLLLTYRVLVAAKAWILLADIVDWTAFLCYVVLKTNSWPLIGDIFVQNQIFDSGRIMLFCCCLIIWNVKINSRLICF